MTTIDLTALRKLTLETGQPTHPELLDTTPMERVQDIEIDLEHITITYNQTINHYYNSSENIEREWIYKYNEDPEFVAAVARVIELARKHLRDLPENVACPPGCAECCSGYEPFVSGSDVNRLAAHLHMTPQEVLDEYVVKRTSADGFHLGYLRKVTDDIADQCVFLKEARPGKFYCGVYEGRPADCRDFSPIGCDDVNKDLPRNGVLKFGAPFQPKQRKNSRRK